MDQASQRLGFMDCIQTLETCTPIKEKGILQSRDCGMKVKGRRSPSCHKFVMPHEIMCWYQHAMQTQLERDRVSFKIIKNYFLSVGLLKQNTSASTTTKYNVFFFISKLHSFCIYLECITCISTTFLTVIIKEAIKGKTSQILIGKAEARKDNSHYS